MNEGQAEAAQAVLEKVLAAKPDFLAARYQLTSLLIAKRDVEQASAQIAAIRKVSKEDGLQGREAEGRRWTPGSASADFRR